MSYDRSTPSPENFDQQTAELFVNKLKKAMKLSSGVRTLDDAIKELQQKLEEQVLPIPEEIPVAEQKSLFLPPKTIAEYQQRAAQLSLFLDKSTTDRLANAAMGLCGEYSEFSTASAEERVLELGDFFWYVCEGCTALGMSVGSPDFVARYAEAKLKAIPVEVAIGRFNDEVKKIFSGRRELEESRGLLLAYLWVMFNWVLCACDDEVPLNVVYTENLRKLEERFCRQTSLTLDDRALR